jgi:methylmalonyl-CoA mutase cobalamin-binding subunit
VEFYKMIPHSTISLPHREAEHQAIHKEVKVVGVSGIDEK